MSGTRIPHLIKVREEDCPRVVVNGETYKDVTNLLFFDGQHRKIYPSAAESRRKEEASIAREKAEVKRALEEEKRRKGKLEKFAREIMPADYLKANEETGYIDEYVIENRGKITQEKMAENLGFQVSVIHAVVRKLAGEGKIRIKYAHYLDEEKEMIKHLYLGGMSAKAISVEVNERFKNERTRNSINSFLQREGIRRGE